MKAIKLRMYRKQMDKFNDEMLQIFIKRMKQAEKITKLKGKHDMPLEDARREKQILKGVRKSLRGEKKLLPFAEKFFEDLIEISKDYQQDIYDRVKK